MKNKFFNGKLYLEGLRQTKVLGLFLAMITILGRAMIPIGGLISPEKYTVYDGGESAFLSLLEYESYLWLFMFVAPIVLTMHLFSFLNKRNGSDFYHSLPCSRACLFLSFSMSIITWLLGIIITTGLVNGVLYSFLPGMRMLWIYFSHCIFTYFPGAFLIMAIFLLAKSLTGTTFNNVVVAAFIGGLPRTLIWVFVDTFNRISNIVSIEKTGIFTNTAYNIPYHFVFRFFFAGPVHYTVFDLVGGMIYTFVLAMIYFTIGLIFFHYRKSEVAQRSTLNTFMRHMLRCIITLPFLLVIPVRFLDNDLRVETMLLFFFLAVVVYFGYEFITTRKMKNLLKALPVFMVVVLLSVSFGGIILGAAEIALSDTPNPEEIQSVYIQFAPQEQISHYNLLQAKNLIFKMKD